MNNLRGTRTVGDQNLSKNPRPLQIHNLTGDSEIADQLACHLCTIRTMDGKKRNYTGYSLKKRPSSTCTPFTNDLACDAELREDLIKKN